MKGSHRAGLALLTFAALYALAHALELEQYVHPGRMRAAVESAGSLGTLLFVAIFTAAVVAQVPGIPFVLLAPGLFALPKAWLLCALSSNLSVMINFVLVRRVGGSPLAQLKQPALVRILASLERRPIVAVALLRTLTIMFPPVTSALALTSLSFRDHTLGSALGMLLPVTALIWLGALMLGST